MWRYYYTIVRNTFRIFKVIKDMNILNDKAKKNSEEYSEVENYEYVNKEVVDIMLKTGRVETKAYGIENLPKDGGYMMFPNHEGKYDVYGIFSVHKKPCSYVIDINKANTILIKQLTDTLRGKRLDKQNNRQAMTVINEVAKEVAEGRKFILFPEGMYDNKKKNKLWEFKSGCFKISLKSKTPIVPVVLYDSYKVYNSMCFGKLTTEVHFLEPIMYDEYKNMSTKEIAKMVKEKIRIKIEEISKSKEV